MASDRVSSSLEDYLEAIFHIVSKKRAAKAKDIAKSLSVASSSVTGALKALAEKGLVNYAPYDLITLTTEGEKMAHDVIMRHDALRAFFIRILALDREDAEDAACKMEHAVSEKVLRRLLEFVRFSETWREGSAKWDEEKNCFVNRYSSENGEQ